MGDPTVAAVIPTMNRPDRLQSAIQSVNEQTYDKIEVIVVDGSQGKETRDKISKIQSRMDLDITYVGNEEPQGVSRARNQGVEQTDAKYIAFLDDDDQWDTEKTRKQINLLESKSSEFSICYTGHRTIWPDSTTTLSMFDLRGDVFETILVSNELGVPSTILVARKSFEDIGGFNEEMVRQEDWEFYLRMARNHKFECISEPLITRNIHDGTISSDHNLQKQGRKKILRKFEQSLSEHELTAEAWANYHRTNGIAFCSEGRTAEGRTELRRSLSYEINLVAIMNITAALFGPVGYRVLSRLKNIFI